MNIWLRRTLLLFLTVVFFTIAPLLLFYASGWRYNTTAKHLEKVGAVTIETEPKGALVWLDKKLLNKKTPLTIRNILPGQHYLHLSKNGYYDWSRPVDIESGKSLSITPLYLLKKPVASRLLREPHGYLYQSPDEKKLAVPAKEALTIMTATEAAVATIPLGKEIKEVQWSPDSNKLLVQLGDQSFSLVDVERAQETATLADLFGQSFQEAWWSPTENDIIYALSDGRFYRLNTFQKTATALADDSGTRAAADDFLVAVEGDRLTIRDYGGTRLATATLATGAALSLLPPVAGQWPLLDVANQALYLYDPRRQTVDRVPEKVKNFSWSKDDSTMFFYNSHELWLWDWQAAEKELIVRTSEEIVDATWFKKRRYAIYSPIGNSLKIVELADPPRNTYQLDLTGTTELLPDASGNILYALSADSGYKLDFSNR